MAYSDIPYLYVPIYMQHIAGIWNLHFQFYSYPFLIANLLLILNITTQPLKQTHDFLFFTSTQSYFNATPRAAKPLHLSQEAGWKIEISAQPYVIISLSDLMDRFTWPASCLTTPKVSMETKPISIELAVVSCSTVLGRARFDSSMLKKCHFCLRPTKPAVCLQKRTTTSTRSHRENPRMTPLNELCGPLCIPGMLIILHVWLLSARKSTVWSKWPSHLLTSTAGTASGRIYF